MLWAIITFRDDSVLRLKKVPSPDQLLVNGGVLVDATWDVEMPFGDTNNFAHKIERVVSIPKRSIWIGPQQILHVEFES